MTAIDIASGSEPSTTAGRPRRRADIEGLRAIAVLLVVAFHADLATPGGFVGVDVFFVISGFVIMGMLLPQLQAVGTVRLRWFYVRRIRRLLPALALTTTVTAAASALLLSPLGPQQATASTGIAASVFTANIELYRAGGGGYFDLRAEANALLHTWSLSVEEQFYLFLPAFLILAWRATRRLRSRWSARQVTTALVAVAVAASFALSLVTSFGHGILRPELFAFYASPTRAWEFGVGVLLALVTPVLLRLSAGVSLILGVVGGALIAISALAISPTTIFPGLAALLPVGGAALLLVAGTASNRGTALVLGTRPLVWIGGLSYSWYLWHWPIIVFAKAVWPSAGWLLVVGAVFSLLPAWLSWRYLETPIRVDDRYLGRRIVPLAAICVLVPLLACVALNAVAERQRDSAAYQELEDAQQKHADVLRGCDRATPLSKRTDDACTWSVDDARGTVYLLGDSNAGQFTEAVATAANREGFDFTVATKSGCPFVDLDASGGQVPADCHRFVRDAVSDLAAKSPALVVIASDSTAYVNDDQFELRDPATGHRAATTPAKAALWEAGLGSVLRQLDQAGIPTAVVHTIPQYPDSRFMECPPVRVLRDEASCAVSSLRERIEEQQGPTRSAELRAVSAAASARAVDFTDEVCTVELCSTFRDGMWLYRDGAHLSVRMARTLTDRFEQVIADVAAGPP